jgi:hypothetical protein
VAVQPLFEDALSFESRQPCDRYGVGPRGVLCYSCGFVKAQEKAALRVSADLGNQGICSVRFKNISLVPGENQGFEIVTGDTSE